MNDSRPSIPLSVLLLFVALVATFVLTVLFVVVPSIQETVTGAFLWMAGVLGLLGLLLVISSVRAPIADRLKRTLLITGVSATGAVASVVLHNLFYALASLTEEMIWLASLLSVLEAALFLFATVLFPATFVIAAAAVIVQLLRTRRTPHHPSTGGLNAAH